MSSEQHMMFVYGTLKAGQPNNHFLLNEETGKAEFVSSGRTTASYPLVIAGAYNIPYLLHVPGKGYQVEGEIYKVDSQKRDFMDEFESHPTYYERLEEAIVLDKVKDSGSSGAPESIPCWVYFMRNYKPEMLELVAMPSYDSKGPHGLAYVERYQRTTTAYEEFKKS